MAAEDEKKPFDQAVEAEVARLMAAQQAQYAQQMTSSIQQALRGIDDTRLLLEKERQALNEGWEQLREAQKQAIQEAEHSHQTYFEAQTKRIADEAQAELLRQLCRTHLENGKEPADIAAWLGVTHAFVEEVEAVMRRHWAASKPKLAQASLSYTDMGRGGTIRFQQGNAHFDMWWEFAGGDALAIVDVPSHANWELATKLPLSKRDEILHFIGHQLLADKVSSGGSFTIGPNTITLYT